MPINKKTVAALAASMLLSTPAFAATSFGPSAYLSEADSPFAALLGNAGFYLENFEDGALNTPGVSASSGQVFGPATNADSVDGDDGNIDGSGRSGKSYWSGTSFGPITFTFDSAVLGALPTHAGLVVTHTVGTQTFAFFDEVGNLIDAFDLSIPSSPNGETSADRFVGVISDTGIARITTTGAPIEMDHLQYYVTPVPLPAAAWLFASAALGLVGAARRRAG